MSRMLMPWLAAMALLLAAPVRADDVADDRPAADPPAVADADQAAAEDADETEEKQLLDRVMRERAAEQETVASIREEGAFQQTRAIDPPEGGGKILAFHPLADGGVVIATGAGDGYGERTLAGSVAALLGLAGGDPPKAPDNALVWLDAAGERRHAAPLPFACKGVTVAPDGGVIAVGGDQVVVFSAEGEQLAEATAPHVTLSDDELARLREEIVEQHREQLAARRVQYDRIVAMKARLEEVPEEERTRRQTRELAQATAMVRSYEVMLGRADASAESAVETGLAKARAIHRVAASRDHLFLVAREPAGYGFGVWRCGRDFTSPEKIVDGLRGCCGQMDVQVIGDELVIAENAAHHVAVYGLDGEPLRTFGEASRTDIRKGFGGCCNPMNACPGPGGSLLLSESNGLVKQFAPDGTLVEILGAANVQSGCKNSSIGLSADGGTLYYLDVQTGRVLVMERRS